MSRYLITGGAGFIGSNIVEELLRRNEKVRVLDNFVTGKRENIKPFLEKIELIVGDIRDKRILKQALKGIDYVIHEAAIRSVLKSIENPVLTNEVNVTGTLNLLIASKDAKVKRFIYASSSSIYGQTSSFPQKESQKPDPISPYAVSKLAAENYCIIFAKNFGLETVSLRYFNVFGPRQNPESRYSAVIPAFIERLLKDLPPTIDGDGRQKRDFTYIDNVVEATLKAVAAPNIVGRVINIGCGDSISILEMAKILNEILKKNIKPEFGSPRPGDVQKTQADITEMKELLKFSSKVDFSEGLKRTVEWFKGWLKEDDRLVRV